MLLGSCQKKEFVQMNSDVKVDLRLSTHTLILNENTPDNNVLEVSWKEPSVGFESAPTYFVMFDLDGGDFSNAQEFSAGTDLHKVLKSAELNNKLLSLGVQGGVPTDVAVKVRAKLSKYKSVYSEAATLTVTAYATILDLSTEWGVVGSATPGGWGSPDIPDLPLLQRVGLSAAPKDAVQEVLDVVDYISYKKGGETCVRDVIEQVLRVQGKWTFNLEQNDTAAN